MIETSPTTAKLDAALAKAQGEFVSAPKENVANVKSERGSYSYNYADLAGVWKACRASLSAVGIAVSQWLVHGDDNRLHIVTRLACAGEWMQARWSMPVGKQDAQGYGSAVTYARRYALSAAVGVVSDADDDAHAATEVEPQRKAPAYRKPEARQETKATASLMTADQLEGWQLEITLAESMGLEKLRELAADMTKRLAPEHKKQLEGSFRAAERRAKERYAAGLKGNGASP